VHGQPAPPPASPNTADTRLEALALIQTLNATLLSSRGATLTLEAWCRDHRMVAEPRIVADLECGAVFTRDHQPFAEVREVDQRDILAFPPPRRPH
jgi:hypothetical protein